MSKEEKQEEEKKQGTVKWFNNARGFGFIEPAIPGEDIFVHYSNVNYDPILEADQVEFEQAEGKKGVEAVKVQKLSPPLPDDPEKE